MAKLISASIDLSKIDKSRIFEKDGKKWYNIQIAVNDEVDTYGNSVGISAAQTKEEREAKEKKVYLGNGKVFWSSEGAVPAAAAKVSAPVSPEDDLPF